MAGLYPTPNLPYAMSGLAAVSGELADGGPDMYPHPFLRSSILGGGGVEAFSALADQARSDYLPGDASGADTQTYPRLPPALPTPDVPGLNMLPMPSVPLFRPNRYGNRFDVPHLERWLQQMLRTRNWGRSRGASTPDPHTLDSDLHTDVAPVVEAEFDIERWVDANKQWEVISANDLVTGAPSAEGTTRWFLGHQTEAGGTTYGYGRPCVSIAGVIGGASGVDIFPTVQGLYFGVTTDRLIQIDSTWTGAAVRQLDFSFGLNMTGSDVDYAIMSEPGPTGSTPYWKKGFFYEIQKDGVTIGVGGRARVDTLNFTDGVGATVAVSIPQFSNTATVDISAVGVDEHFDFIKTVTAGSSGPVKTLEFVDTVATTRGLEVSYAHAGTEADVTIALPAGSGDADLLKYNAGATKWEAAGLAWANGDILYYNAGIQRLAKGANDLVLTLVAGVPAWAASAGAPHNLLSATHSDTVVNAVTAGSLIYGNATPKWTELTFASAPGGNGDVLTLQGGLPAWETPVDCAA